MLNSFFKITKYESRGIYFATIVLLLVLGIKVFIGDSTKNHFSELKAVGNSPKNTYQQSTVTQDSTPKKSKVQTSELLDLDTLLDINTATVNDLKKLGFSSLKANSMINYRKALGGFKNFNQLSKTYHLSPKDLEWLKNNSKIVVKKMELNTATAKDLQKIYGIGAVLSDRIIKYRDLLGGFHQLEQLEQVYGIKEETLTNCYQELEVDPSKIQKINIRGATYQNLVQHPYIEEVFMDLFT